LLLDFAVFISKVGGGTTSIEGEGHLLSNLLLLFCEENVVFVEGKV